MKKSVLIQHVKSVKHATGKERLASKQARERNIADMLRKYDKDEHPIGESLSEEVRVYRIKVVTSFLKAGVPLSKIDCFRDLLEENTFQLFQASNLSQLVPFIHQQEQISVKNQIDQQEISIIFYGTIHACEALVILVRFFFDEKWNIQQRVVKLMLLAKSLTGEEVARQLIVSLTTELGIESDLLIAALRDRASVNNVAIRTLSIVFPEVLDIGCFSHTLDHVGEHMKIPVLEEFLKGWIGLFSRSPKARLACNSLTGIPVPSYSDTRWWSK